jgi:uncharacterized secreted protein with C-terminal beta-propeller domain
MKQNSASSSRYLRPSVIGAACGLLLVSACNSGSEPDDLTAGPAATGRAELQLTRANSCDDLLGQVQGSLVTQLEQRAEELRTYQPGTDPTQGGNIGSGGVGVGVALPPTPTTSGPTIGAVDAPPGVDTPAPGVPSPRAEADESPGTPDNAGLNGNTPSTPPKDGSGFSNTTVQVKDVDEADIVKADGDLIYLLHGGSLFVLQGWPANATQILASATIEGQPSEMFVRDGKVVVFSNVQSNLAAEAGVPTPYGYGYYYGSPGYTKLTVLDVDSSTPQVVRESYLEGNYVSARRHAGLVRAVVQNGFKVPQLGNPAIEYFDLFGQPYPQEDIDAQVDAWLTRTIRSVRNTDLGDWLPREFSRENGALVEQAPRCRDYYAPTPGLTESGVTSVVSLDMDDVTGALGGATILGRAERVYSNEDVILITQTDYRFRANEAAKEQTLIHRFDLDGASTKYTASGAVAGSIHNQFSLDERAGVIRVSTTEQRFDNVGIGGPPILIAPTPTSAPAGVSAGMAAPNADLPLLPAPPPDMSVPPQQPQGPINRIVTLETEGKSLVQLGATEDFGSGEQIYATRFIGERGYVVTFRRTDPLFVVDLADPAHPSVVGELRIPGFSDYLYPLDDNHLFAIGQNATSNGVVQGLALSIFDVSDPANPWRAQSYVYPDAGSSPANIDHRAISFHPDRDVIAFPYQNYNTGDSTLELFQLSAETGIQRLGGMGMSDKLSLEQCLVNYGYAREDVPLIAAQNGPDWQTAMLASCRSSQYFRRSLFRDDFVYGIGNTGVYAYNLDALSAGAVGEVSLPPEVYTYGGDQVAYPGKVGGSGGSANASEGGSGGSTMVDVGGSGGSAMVDVGGSGGSAMSNVGGSAGSAMTDVGGSAGAGGAGAMPVD